MGMVYRTEDVRLHRFVALKFPPDGVARGPHALARFHLEAQAACALNHPNICTIHDIGEEDSKAFIAMEYLGGATLKHRIEGKALYSGPPPLFFTALQHAGRMQRLIRMVCFFCQAEQVP